MQIDHNSHLVILCSLCYAKDMKKYLALLIIIILTLTACGNNDVNRITGDVTNINQGSGSGDGDVVTQIESASDEVVTQPSYKGYVFSHLGVLVIIDADFAPILAALGEPRSYFEAPSCAFEGLDKVYTFNGFEIDTYPQGDDDFVSAIVFRDDTVATMEGLRIGSTRSEMEAVYGTPRLADNGSLIYDKDGMRLCFILADDIIISIEYQTTVLDQF